MNILKKHIHVFKHTTYTHTHVCVCVCVCVCVAPSPDPDTRVRHILPPTTQSRMGRRLFTFKNLLPSASASASLWKGCRITCHDTTKQERRIRRLYTHTYIHTCLDSSGTLSTMFETFGTPSPPHQPPNRGAWNSRLKLSLRHVVVPIFFLPFRWASSSGPNTSRVGPMA